VITVFLATNSDTDSRTSSFHQSRKLILIQSVTVATRVGFTATVCMCYAWNHSIWAANASCTVQLPAVRDFDTSETRYSLRPRNVSVFSHWVTFTIILCLAACMCPSY